MISSISEHLCPEMCIESARCNETYCPSCVSGMYPNLARTKCQGNNHKIQYFDTLQFQDIPYS